MTLPATALVRMIALVFLVALGALVVPAVTSAPASAQSLPACDDEVDNDGDGLFDWFEDPDCQDDPDGTSEGVQPVCRDRQDNDDDGLVDRADPGCASHSVTGDETDPPPVPSRFRFTYASLEGCAIATGVKVLPDLAPKSVFPFNDVALALRGLSGQARGVRGARELPLASDPGYLFAGLRPGRYEISGRYPGDRFRLPSAAKRRVNLPASRCRVYFTGTGTRRYKPRVVYFGASQRIYGISWRRWGRATARGRGTYPVNNCIPYCAAGRTTDYPVTVRLSRVRVCNGYEQYLTMKRTYVGRGPTGSARTETVNFGFVCD